MATWKKVIVSGSNAELNNLYATGDITGSGILSASGKLFGQLDEDTNIEQVIVYDTSNGELKYKTLNLVTTERASRLALIGFENNDDSNFKAARLSYDSRSSGDNISSGIGIYEALSASFTQGNTELTFPYSGSIDILGLNTSVVAEEGNTDSEVFYDLNGPTNTTSSIETSRQPFYVGSSKTNIKFNFQAVDNTFNNFVEYFDGVNLNFGRGAFDRGGIGKLKIFVNDAITPVREVTLDGAGSQAINSTVSDILVNLFETKSNVGSGGAADPNKHYRSGSFTVNIDAQQDGYNYAFAIHTGSDGGTEFSYITNFAEWFYDIEGAGLAINSASGDASHSVAQAPVFTANDTSSISGIKFYDSTAADDTEIIYHACGINQYRNIYPTTNGIRLTNMNSNMFTTAQVTQSGDKQTGATEVETVNASTEQYTLSALNNVADANTTNTRITASIGVTFSSLTDNFYQPQEFAVAAAGFAPNASASDSTLNLYNSTNVIQWQLALDHITDHKDNFLFPTESYRSFLVNNLTDTSNEYEFESFRSESYRIQSRSYDTGDTIPGTYAWDGRHDLSNTTTAGFVSASAVYATNLVNPDKVGNSGDFTTDLGPANQPDYTSIDNGGREYFRYFKIADDAQTGGKQLSIELAGSALVCREDDTTNFVDGGVGIKVYLWRSAAGTGGYINGEFTNVLTPGFRSGNTVNSDSKFIPVQIYSNINYSENAFTPAGESATYPIGVLKTIDTSTNNYSLNEIVIVRIKTPVNWSGFIDAMAIRFGTPGAGTNPYLGDSTSGHGQNQDYSNDQL